MHMLMSDIIYLGLKSSYYITKYVSILSYNTVAYIKGYELIELFPKSDTRLLLEEVKNLKRELIEVKRFIINNKSQYEYISIEDVTNENIKPIKNSVNDNNIKLITY